ncbi:MAG: aldehyde ferredoxin oxidoreductase family protein [Dehalococcoidia bacterium]|nr:aldehyde ferredoxin oxidoreductase family protein [Dehalococcoidia bacterium]
MERFGYWNKILHVDLTAGTTSVEEPGDAFYRSYGGGRGFIGHYLLKHVPQGADPLGPNNVLVFAPGVLTGAPVPGAGRHSVGAKSPLSGGFGEAEAGGFWGSELKRAGWDAIVVHGASASPVYLWINEDTVEIRDASHLWGKVTGDVEEAIHAELGDPRIRVAQIGPAGENLVRFANVANDLNEFAGRSGMGAVMGSKKLKAIAVRGKTPVRIADQPALLAISKWVSSTVDQVHRGFHEYGTGGAMQGKSLDGGIPTLNYRLGTFEGTDKVDAIAIKEEVRIDMGACFACSVRCKKVVQIEMREEDAGVTRKGVKVAVDPKHRYRVDPKYGGPEYESLASLGTNLGVDDIVAVCKSNEICNMMGMDTISAGSTVAWAMEAYEKGVLTPEDTDGVKLEFRDGDAVVQMLQMIARREGIGDLLAEGSQRAAAKIGQGSEDYLTTVKGMEMAMHDPRHMAGMRASYLLAPTGGDHMRQTGDKNGLRNQVGMCHFLAYDDDQTAQILNAVTGWGVDAAEMVATAHRGLTLARLFNMREGMTRADDRLPKRFSEDLPKHKGLAAEDLEKIVTDYYVEQGWDPATGAPTRETVRALGIAADAVGLV